MPKLIALCIILAAGCAVLALPEAGLTQPPPCPPGMVWSPGGCRPAPPPPGYRPPHPVPPQYAPPPPVYDPTIKQVARRYVSLRTCPGEYCPPATTLSRGTPVRILSRQGPYVFVRVPDSPIEGWVKRNRLTP
jgi:hypothetical protein